MSSIIEGIDCHQEAGLLRKRSEQMLIQLQRLGPVQYLLDDYKSHHKRLMHLQDHYGC